MVSNDHFDHIRYRGNDLLIDFNKNVFFYSQEKGFNLIIHFFGLDQKDRDTFHLIRSKIGCESWAEPG